MTRRAEVVTATRDQLGECPVWDERTGTLHRVDALAGAVVQLDVATGAERRGGVGRHLGSLVLRAGDDGLLVAGGGGVRAGGPAPRRGGALAPGAPRGPGVVVDDGG